MVFSYDNINTAARAKGEIYILTYKTNAGSFASISKLRSGFTWLDYFASHHVT